MFDTDRLVAQLKASRSHQPRRSIYRGFAWPTGEVGRECAREHEFGNRPAYMGIDKLCKCKHVGFSQRCLVEAGKAVHEKAMNN